MDDDDDLASGTWAALFVCAFLTLIVVLVLLFAR